MTAFRFHTLDHVSNALERTLLHCSVAQLSRAHCRRALGGVPGPLSGPRRDSIFVFQEASMSRPEPLVSSPLFLAMPIGANATLGYLNVPEGGRSNSAAASCRRIQWAIDSEEIDGTHIAIGVGC
jgi:hypothetical protein